MELSLEDIEQLMRAAFEKGRLSAFPEVVKGGWDESLHPRGDDGRFINKDDISAAAKSPAKAAALRKQVTKPEERAKLEQVLTAEQKDNQAAAKRTGVHGVSSAGFGEGLSGPQNPAIVGAPNSREPAVTATTGDHPNGERPGVGETVDLARQLRAKSLDASNRATLAERLGQHTAEELKEIKRQLGIRATGRKADLASKILMAVNGMSYPEQGFTGALPVRGQGVHHYEDGQLVRIEREPSPGVYASRVTPEEAHAVIDYHIGRGTLLKKEAREELAGILMNRMSYRDIAELKNRLGLKASGRKEIFAKKILDAVEAKHRDALTDPAADWNRPDPVGTLGSLAERKQYFETMHGMYGDGVHPDRQESVDDAASRLQLAIQSPFASFNRDGAIGEAKAAINDLYNKSEMLAAAAKAGLKLDPKDGKVPQQIAAAVARMAGNDDNPANDEGVIGAGAAQHITPAHHTHRIVGNTFKHKDDIVKNGGVWNSAKKQWTIDAGAADFLHPDLKLQPLEEPKPANAFARSKSEEHTHRVIGDTYPNREAIKKAGGAWDAVGKYWTVDANGAKLLPKGLQAQPLDHRMFADTDKLTEAESESKRQAGFRKVAENIFDAHQKHLANPKPGVKPPADDFLGRVDSYEAAPWQRSPIGMSQEDEKAVAGHLRQLMERQAAKVEPAAEQPAASVTPDVSESDTSPGRAEHLQAVASSAGVDELRDAADTVSRIEDIPVGERTADDRAELKRAKELAAAGDAPLPSSTGAKNPKKYVDDHPEVTADNPLGLPARDDEKSVSSSTEKPSISQENSAGPAEQASAPSIPSLTPEPDSHAAKLADLESKMAEAKREAANKSNGKGDRAVWERHHDELDDQHNALTGKVRTLAEHEGHVKRAGKRKDADRLAKLKEQEAAVHAQHIDNHVKRLDRRIAKMDEANTWAAHVAREHGKVKWDSEMETVYGSPKDAIENGFPKHLIADESKGETGSSIDQIAQDLEWRGDLQVPSDRNDSEYLIEKLSSGETFDGGHDEHRQKLAAERDAIQQERDGKPETDAAIVETLKAGKTPKETTKPADVPQSTGSVTESPDTPKVADVKQHSLDEIMGAAAGQDKKTAAEQPKHNYPRNPDGSFAEIHGAYSGQEKRPVKGNGIASDNRSTNKEKERPAPREWTPEEIEQKKRDIEDRKQWGEMQNTIGKFKWLGENPNSKALNSSSIPTKRWREFAESVGPEKISQIISKLEPMIHGEIDAQVADDEGKAWFKNHLKSEADYYRDLLRGGKGHEKKVPNSHYAMQLIEQAMDTTNVKGVNNFQRFKNLHNILAPILKPGPDAPDTATSHGQSSAVPIGVTQKDDYESRGRGVRKAVESKEYLLPL